MTADQIKATLEKTIAESRAEVNDLTGGGDHFELTIVSDKFAGLGMVQRHQMIYGALKVAATEEIHALSIKAYTLDEWAKA